MDNNLSRGKTKNEKIKPFIRVFEYTWIDDYHYNLGYNELKGKFIGTKQEFHEYWQMEQDGQGFNCWNITERDPTKEELAYIEE